MAPQQTSSFRLRIGAVLIAVSLMFSGFAYAFLNEAISYAFEAATVYVKEGFEVREDNWSGEVKPDEPLLVKHQLFRGNEYWFWAGTSTPGSTIRVDIFDGDGNSIGVESFQKNSYAGVRARPQKTGTYFIRVIVTYDPEAAAAENEANGVVDELAEFTGKADWGLVYGYR